MKYFLVNLVDMDVEPILVLADRELGVLTIIQKALTGNGFHSSEIGGSISALGPETYEINLMDEDGFWELQEVEVTEMIPVLA